MAWTLVTGGAKRLGSAICQTLAECGYDIVIHYNHSEQEVLEVRDLCRRQGVRAEIIQGDFSTRESVDKFCLEYLDRFGNTKNLVNNVGNFLIKPALTTTIEEWLEIFQNNLNAPFAISKALAPRIAEHPGSIINLGVAGLESMRADTYSTAYSCAKMALLMLTKSLAREMMRDRVRVNMVSPGYMNISVDLPQDESKLPMGRAGMPTEVSDLIAFLLDPTGAYITGQNIEVAGGLCL